METSPMGLLILPLHQYLLYRDFASEEKKVPADKDIQTALPFINYEDVAVEGNKLTFAKEAHGT